MRTTDAAQPGAAGRLGAASGQRLPVPPRERQPALAALAVLLILGGALASAVIVLQSTKKSAVIEIVEPVAAGVRIPASALREVQISGSGFQAVGWEFHDQVAQDYAAIPLVPNSLLTNQMVSRTSAGRVMVGLALKPGQLPATPPTAGQNVVVYAVGAPGTQSSIPAGTVLSAQAEVCDIPTLSNNAAVQAGTVLLSVCVNPDEAPAVVEAGSQGAAAIALLPPGASGSGGPAPGATAPPTTGPSAVPSSSTPPSASNSPTAGTH